MQMEGLSSEEASMLLDRHGRVEQVRDEAETILNRKLPPVISSKFIEEFCLTAPKIGVRAIQYELNRQSTVDNWRFLTDLMLIPGEDTERWFSVEVMPVEVSENEGVVSVLHTESSPAHALAAFVQTFSAELESAHAPGELRILPDSEMSRIIPCIARAIDTLKYRATSLREFVQGAELATEGPTLRQILESPAVVPAYAPSDAVQRDILMGLDLDRANTSLLERFDSLKEAINQQLEVQIASACRALIGALGEARPLPQRQPLEIFRGLRDEQERNQPGAKLRVATAYVSLVAEGGMFGSDQKKSVDVLLAAALQDVREHEAAARTRVGEMPEFLQEKALAQVEFYQYVRNAIENHLQTLASVFSR